jgi:hypothetical protein
MLFGAPPHSQDNGNVRYSILEAPPCGFATDPLTGTGGEADACSNSFSIAPAEQCRHLLAADGYRWIWEGVQYYMTKHHRRRF